MSVNNIAKIMQYIEPLAKKPVLINGVIYDNQVKSIKLNDNFFKKDDCKLCGRCCINEENIFTKSEIDKIINIDYEEYKFWNIDVSNAEILKQIIQEEKIIVNGKEKTIYRCKKQHNYYQISERGFLDRCRWLVQTRENRLICSIHPVSSITCKMPHLKFYHNRKYKSLSIGVGEYGRNWALKCPAKFDNIFSKNDKVEKFEHLKRVADDLGIDTYIPEILKFLEKINEDNYEYYLNKNIIEEIKKEDYNLFNY